MFVQHLKNWFYTIKIWNLYFLHFLLILITLIFNLFIFYSPFFTNFKWFQSCTQLYTQKQKTSKKLISICPRKVNNNSNNQPSSDVVWHKQALHFIKLICLITIINWVAPVQPQLSIKSTVQAIKLKKLWSRNTHLIKGICFIFWFDDY